MTNTNIRTISTNTAYETLIEESFHIAKWQLDLAEKAIYFKLMKDISSNTYYKLKVNNNSEKFNEILDYLTEVYADAEIEEDE